MAQKEIVLQQVRMGKQRDLPLALEKGQVGFSTDVGRLFIGLPSTSEPASLVAGRNWNNAPNSGQENVEVLTEFTPWEVINKVFNKPYVIDVKPESTTSTFLAGSSRVFIDYVAYDDKHEIMETGTSQMVWIKDKVLLYQNNNTSDEDGLYYIEFLNPSYDERTKRMEITVKNSSKSQFRVEFLVRGWDIVE